MEKNIMFWNPIIEQIKWAVVNCKDEVPQGYRLLNQRKIEDLDATFDFLLELFDKEEKEISRQHENKYVTNDYENGVRHFAKMIVEILLTHHIDFRNYSKYETLCGKRHIAYAYYSTINTGIMATMAISESKYQKILYMGLVNFYNQFYGNFSDNEEAIELLCKYYPHEMGIEEHVREVAAALYTHVSNAGTPNDLGYAFGGIELIRKYIGNLPTRIVDALLNEYALYLLINNKIYRHQIFEIIQHAGYIKEYKRKLKFWYLDSLLIANTINMNFLKKLKKDGRNVETHNNYYDYKLLDERIVVFDEPVAYWNNDNVGARWMFVEYEPVLEIQLMDTQITVRNMKNEQSALLEYKYDDWALDSLQKFETEQKLGNLIFDSKIRTETSDMSMTFSLVYLDHYRGLTKQIVDLDHKSDFNSEKNVLTQKAEPDNKIPHIYGKCVYSLSCIVGKNATGKTSIIDFLRETFFKLIRLIVEQKLTCTNGYIKAEDYADYDILDKNVNFLVTFSLGTKMYFLTNITEVKAEGINPFSRDVYINLNKLSKIAYFSNQLRSDQQKLLREEENAVIYDKNKREKKIFTKANAGFRVVDYSETQSFIGKRRAIELAQKIENEGGIINKDICYQLSFLKKNSPQDISAYIDASDQKEYWIESWMNSEKESFLLTDEKKDVDKFDKFVTMPDAVMGRFSAGQYAKFSFLLKLYWFLEGDEEEIEHYNQLAKDSVFSNEEILLDGESALIFIDEGEIYYHPEWQRAYIKTLLDLVNSKPRVVQIIVTTNSPFIISDILNEDIIYLSADKNEEQSRKRRAEYTLGQNIHTLLKDNFYMKYTIGEYARELIETIMLCLSSKNDIKANIKLRRYFDEIDDYYNAFYLLIEEIGEPVYKHNLRKLLEESSFAKKKNKDAEEQISQLEEEKRKIQEKINILKEKNQID